MTLQQGAMSLQDFRIFAGRPGDQTDCARHEQGCREQAPNSHNCEVIVERSTVVKHHERQTSGPQHPSELSDRLIGLLEMVDETVAPDEIEAIVLEGQRGRIALNKVAGQTVKLEASSGQLNRSRTPIQADVARASTSELGTVCRDAATNIEDGSIFPFPETGLLTDVRLQRVPVLRDFVVEQASAGLGSCELEARLGAGPELDSVSRYRGDPSILT
jgi:hypothetical protein